MARKKVPVRRKKVQQELLGADIAEIKFAKEIVKNGGNATQAAFATTSKPISHDSAKQKGHALMKRGSVQELIKIEMDTYEITPNKLASVLSERLEDDDNPAQQLAAWDRCMQLLGWDPRQKKVVEHKHLHVEHRNVIMDQLREEPPSVQRFVAISNRMPTKRERSRLVEATVVPSE